jgi:ADP-ribose pyrophosphatase YjhB (NUDIX family)
MLTPDGQVLLMRVQEPSSGRTFWITPGGEVEDGGVSGEE